MSFERPKDFKINLSKAMDVLKGNNDLLKNDKEYFLRKEKFKLEALVNQNPEHTEFIYKTAKGQNVAATFQKLHIEVLDLQFATSIIPRSSFAPVVSSSSHYGREIIFKTIKGKRDMKVQMNLLTRPKSIVFPNAEPPKYIQVKMSKKIPASTKLKDFFDQFMNGGGLLVDFIMDSIWPAMFKADELRKEQLLNKEEPLKKELEGKLSFPESSRNFAGNDRGVGRKFETRRDGRDNHRGSFQSNHRKDERNMNDKGDRIPRHSSKFSQHESSRGPMHHKPSIHVFNADAEEFVTGRNFDASRATATGNNGQRDEHQLKGFGKSKIRRSKSRQPDHYGSENKNWRKESHR